MWNKYICSNSQTTCMLGVLILSVKLCKNDGHYSKKEELEILSSISYEKRDEKLLKEILNDSGKDRKPIEYDAKVIKEKMGENIELLEFIIATLYKLAISDQIFSESEAHDISKISKIFGLKQSIFTKLLNKLPLINKSYDRFNKNF